MTSTCFTRGQDDDVRPVSWRHGNALRITVPLWGLLALALLSLCGETTLLTVRDRTWLPGFLWAHNIYSNFYVCLDILDLSLLDICMYVSWCTGCGCNNDELDINVLSCLLVSSFWLHLGLYSSSGKTSYRKISWSLEAARFGFRLFQSLWNLTGPSAAVLPRCLSNFRALRSW